jgi:hypothetical protein
VSAVTGHLIGRIIGIRGAIESGNPFEVTSTSSGTGTSISITGDTTTTNDCAILVAVCTSRDADAANFSSIANADLAYIAEVSDFGASTGSGGSIGAFVGDKATAGAYGSTTVTAASADDWAGWTGAIKPQATSRPHWVPLLASSSASVNAITRSINFVEFLRPNDIIVAVAETNDEAITVTDFTEATNSPQSNTAATRLTVFWKRATGSETNVLTSDSGDHQYLVCQFFRGCIATGDPFDTTSGATGTGTTMTVGGSTTTIANDLVLMIGALTVNGSFSSWANASLTDIVEISDLATALGADGTVGWAIGDKATSGAYGDTTATVSSGEWAGWVGALKGDGSPSGSTNQGQGFFSAL